MTSIAQTIAALPGPEFQAGRYPCDYAVQLAMERDVTPAEHVDAAFAEVRARLRPGVKRGPERRQVLTVALRRWCEAQGEDLLAVQTLMADRYLQLNSITRA